MPREPKWDAVIESAARLFSERGFAATSVREVAEGAQITKAGLYYHIREKEDLLARICRHALDRVLEGAYAALEADSDPWPRLANLLRSHIDYFVARPHYLTVLNREMGALSPEPRAQMMALEREYLDLIRGVIRDGQASGAFRSCDVNVASFTLLTVVNNLHVWYDPEGPVDPQELTRQIGAILFDGLATGPGQGG